MLTQTQIAQYHDDGYVIPNYTVPDDMLAAMRRDTDELARRDVAFREFCATLLDHAPGFIQYARNPALLDLIEQVLGPDFALWNMTFFGKPAHDGKEVPWHQDGEYWPVEPMATCRVWIALDDCSTENGCLRYIRGSHRQQRLLPHRENASATLLINQEIGAGEIDQYNVIDMTLKAGQLAIHDVFMVHGSQANLSDKLRRALAMNFMPTTSFFNHRRAAQQHRDLKFPFDHSQRPLFLMRGTDRTGRNDFAIGH